MNKELRDGLSWLYHNEPRDLKHIQHMMRDFWEGKAARTKHRQIAFQIRKNSGEYVTFPRLSWLICKELERENPDLRAILLI